MNLQLNNPVTIVMLCLVVGFIVGLNITLFGLLRGDKRVREEASKWMAAADAGRTTRRSNEAQVDELHQAVQALKSPPTPPHDPPHG